MPFIRSRSGKLPQELPLETALERMGGFCNRPNASGPVDHHNYDLTFCVVREHRALPKSMQVLVSLKVQIVGCLLQFFVSAFRGEVADQHSRVCMQGCRELSWQQRCSPSSTSGTVSKAFCQYYSLSPDACTLFHRGVALPAGDDRTLRQVLACKQSVS